MIGVPSAWVKARTNPHLPMDKNVGNADIGITTVMPTLRLCRLTPGAAAIRWRCQSLARSCAPARRHNPGDPVVLLRLASSPGKEEACWRAASRNPGSCSDIGVTCSGRIWTRLSWRAAGSDTRRARLVTTAASFGTSANGSSAGASVSVTSMPASSSSAYVSAGAPAARAKPPRFGALAATAQVLIRSMIALDRSSRRRRRCSSGIRVIRAPVLVGLDRQAYTCLLFWK